MSDIQITAAFEAGNIVVHAIEGSEARLSMRRDAQSELFQWFHFRVSAAEGRELVLRLIGLNDSAYAAGWTHYQAVVSENRRDWTRAGSCFDPLADNGTLTIRYRPAGSVAWFAYFAPYSLDRHQDLLAAAAAGGMALRSLGASVDGQSIDCLEWGEGTHQVWLYGRQHPGESMAAWWMDGAVRLLADPSSAVARELRRRCRFHIVPNLNPDGTRRGHLRTNALGVDLNREWSEPSSRRSPEVLAVRQAMDCSGVDFAIDVHGDEEIPGVFLDGFEGTPSQTPARRAAYDRYVALLKAHTADFQTALGYPQSVPGMANLAISSNQVAERYGAIAMTLEMPFTDHAEAAEPRQGWSPERSMQLGRDCMAVLLAWLGEQAPS